MKTKQITPLADPVHYSIWERLTLPSPAFFTRIKVIGGALIALTITLAGIKILPGQVLTILGTMGSVMVAVAQFSVDSSKVACVDGKPEAIADNTTVIIKKDD